MSVVVLHLDDGQALLPRPLRGHVLGVQVARDRGRLHAEHVEVERQVGAKRAEGGLAVQVAEMGGEERLRPPGHAERALQLRAGRHDRRVRRFGKRQRSRHVPARAPQRKCRPDDGVLAAAVYRPVVREEGVGDPLQAVSRVLVVDRDGLVGAVPACHHERPADVVAEKVVQRRVRQHQPQPRRAGRDRGSERRSVTTPHEHDRACGALEQCPFLRRELCQRARVGRHHRKRLLLAELARPQACDRLLVGRVAGEVIAAEPLHGHDAPCAQQPHRLLQRQRETRPAVRARRRLGVEATVGRVLVLAAAGGAQRKPGHRRAGAVVRDGGDDGEARPAVRAVHERVAVAAVGRIEELAQAVVAGGGVGRDQGRPARGRVRRSRRSRSPCPAAPGTRSRRSRRRGRAPEPPRRALPRTPPATRRRPAPRSARRPRR